METMIIAVMWVAVCVVVAMLLILLLDRLEVADRLGRLIGRLWPRSTPPYDGDECEVCGHRGHDNITLGSVTKRPEFGGSSGITATFCPEHLPTEHRSR